jgi:hypothetical protein
LGGAPWDREIRDRLIKADAVLVVLSQTSIGSQRILGQVEFAEANAKHIISLVIGSLKEREIPPWIRARSYVDARDQTDHLERLRTAILAVSGATQEPNDMADRRGPIEPGVLDDRGRDSLGSHRRDQAPTSAKRCISRLSCCIDTVVRETTV